jgi:hypothetical protein
MAIPGMDDYPIKLGTLLFTMVEPERGREVEYNRWRAGEISLGFKRLEARPGTPIRTNRLSHLLGE